MDPVSELEDVIRTLAAIENRGSATPGERTAAYWLSDRFAEHGCESCVEEVPAHGTYWWPMGIGTGMGLLAGIASLAGRRWIALLGGLASAASIADDVSSGPRFLRKRVLPKGTCWNAIARTGDGDADRIVVVMAHHDAPHTGRIFDQSLQIWFADKYPRIFARIRTAPPLYWPVLAGPILVVLGSILKRKWLSAVGTLVSAVTTGIFADVGRSPVNQGANDNLSGVAGLVWLARALKEKPVKGVKVIIASCGSEESFQEGIAGFLSNYQDELGRGETFFINLETVGSPELLLLEGEGPIVMRDYEENFKDLVEGVASAEEIRLTRGMRARTTTDSLITSRAGYPTATFTSINEYKALSNYHMMSDTPDNLDWGTVESAARLAEAVVRRLAEQTSSV